MTSKNLKLIAVDERNYFALKNLGRAGDSFNDVLSQLLRRTSGGRRYE
jgi:predicted CopG family antitoxin